MMPLLPEAYHDTIEHHGAYRYWTKEKDATRALAFKELRDEGMNELMTSYGMNDLSMILDDGRDDFIINPNLTVTL
jgi:alkyl hydroperoxide reductase subunit AhpC